MLHSRLARVAELVKESLGEILDREISDPRIPPFVTVHSVKISRDLRSAQVFVTLMEDEDKAAVEEAVEALNESAGYVRTLLGQRVQLRYLPRLHFHYNPSTKYALGLEKVFREIERADDAPDDPEGGEADASSPEDAE